MTRRLEGGLLLGGAALAAFGVVLVNLVAGGGVDAQAGLTFVVFAAGFGGLHLAIRRFAPFASPLLFPPAALLTALGFIEVYRLSPFRAGLQRWWLLIASALGVGLLIVLHRQGLSSLRRFRYLLAGLGVGLLLLPLLPQSWPFPLRGLEVNGSRLWLVVELGFTSIHFQPGEVAKLLVVVFLASYLADRQPALTTAGPKLGPIQLPSPRQLLPAVLVWAGGLFVLVSQRDLGASLLLFGVLVAMLYAATGASIYPVTGLVLGLAGGWLAWRLFPHVQRRVVGWLNPFSDFEGAGYQVAQGWFGMGSGSLSGAGPGLGRPDLIPNAATDFVFAAIGEELGFAGSAAVLALFAVLTASAFGIALKARDRFRKLAAGGLGFTLALQTFLIIGGILRLVPLTGLTLPLMSYGGSSLVGTILLLVLLARISHEEEA